MQRENWTLMLPGQKVRYYTGIGSRKTPLEVQEAFRAFAKALEPYRWILRTGGAEGADQAFADGIKDPNNVEIYIPWVGFNNLTGTNLYLPNDESEKIASTIHPNWGACSQGARKLHSRNVNQILGQNLKTPSQFVLCWTLKGSGGGGTGQAIRLAKLHNIPVLDLGLYSKDFKSEINLFLREHA